MIELQPFNLTLENLHTLRTVMLHLRSEQQDGFMQYEGDGKWGFIATGLPVVNCEELNTLLDLCGIVPDKVVSLGHCDDCQYGGKDRDMWKQPCLKCLQPQNNEFVPK